MADKNRTTRMMRGPRRLFTAAPHEDDADENLLHSETDISQHDEIDQLSSHLAAVSKRLKLLKTLVFVLASCCLILAFILAFAIPQLLKAQERTLYSPAEEAVEWETVVFHNNFHEDRTPYQGPPNDEVDKAWLDLYKDIGIVAIDKESASRLPNLTFPVPGDESRYIVGIEVFHQLHCLNSIRKALYPDRYREKDGKTGDKLLEYQIHLEHCVDSIRQTVMCYSDISTIPWVMNPYHHVPAPDAHTTHVCRKFNKIQEWARERAYTQQEYDLALVSHPYPQTVS